MRKTTTDHKRDILEIIKVIKPEEGELLGHYMENVIQTKLTDEKINLFTEVYTQHIISQIKKIHKLELDNLDPTNRLNCEFIKAKQQTAHPKDIISIKNGLYEPKKIKINKRCGEARKYVSTFKPLHQETVRNYKDRIIESLEGILRDSVQLLLNSINTAIVVAGYHNMLLTEPNTTNKFTCWLDSKFIDSELI